MNKTTVEWTDYTWNTTFGCTHVSEGCRNCYAEALALRFGHSKHPWTKPFEQENVTVKPEKLREPFSIKHPVRIFVDSMSDLFHPLVPDDHIDRVFDVMLVCRHLTFQILTKRPERMQSYVTNLLERRGWRFGENGAAPSPQPLPNVWLGTSVEDQRVVDRIESLVETPAAVRFLSCEPLIGPLNIRPYLCHSVFCHRGHPLGDEPCRCDNLVHWIIAGGESGPRHRPVDADWIRELRDACTAFDVPFFFKQWGGRTPKAGGRLLDGRTWDEMPAAVERGQLALIRAAS